MNSFRSVIQQIQRWQQTHLSSTSLRVTFKQLYQQATIQGRRWQQAIRTHLKPQAIIEFVRYPSRLKPQKYSNRRRIQRLILLLVAVLSLTSAIGYRFYNEPQLRVDTIAPQTLRAPASAKIIDAKTTEANRKAARVAAVPVLQLDQAANQDIYQSLHRLIERGNTLRQQAGAFPFIDTASLSTGTQKYLRQAEEWDWRMATASAEGIEITPPPGNLPKPNRLPGTAKSNSSLQLAILELQSYRRSASAEDFSALTEVITRARQRYAIAAEAISASEEKTAVYDVSLLDLTDLEWTETRSTIRLVLERILSQGIAPGLPDPLLKNAIKTHLDSRISASAAPIATRLLMEVIQPNLVQDPEKTKQRAEQAARSVEDVVVEIRRGEVIVPQGERITQSDFVLLDHFGLSRRRINWWGLLGFSSLVSSAVAIFLLVEKRFHPGLRCRDYILVLLLVLSAPGLVALSIPATGLPAIGLLIGGFYGSALGITSISLLSFLMPIGMEVNWTNLIASAVGGLLGASMTGQLRSREELAMLGGAVGLTQGAVYLLLSLILSTATTTVWYVVLTTAALQSLIGLAWSIIALGISPYLERMFDLVTPVRLAELSNPNRPMLKRLASEAPGTFQHTLFVATLAESAARSLGCNVELVRAGTLYHDIGKMHDPLGFIENQMGGPNKHDQIDNPWMSAAIIKKHVTEGVLMARRCHLPKAIAAFIPEHQGTMPISYFYQQALEHAKANPDLIVNEADFRYDGPTPQSRETGIVMLADSCEAALRSLKDATPEEALAMVNRILRARWQDNQLVDSGLSRAEMTRIAEIFVQVWQQFNHQRIPYPKPVMSPQGGRE